MLPVRHLAVNVKKLLSAIYNPPHSRERLIKGILEGFILFVSGDVKNPTNDGIPHPFINQVGHS